MQLAFPLFFYKALVLTSMGRKIKPWKMTALDAGLWRVPQREGKEKSPDRESGPGSVQEDGRFRCRPVARAAAGGKRKEPGPRIGSRLSLVVAGVRNIFYQEFY